MLMERITWADSGLVQSASAPDQNQRKAPPSRRLLSCIAGAAFIALLSSAAMAHTAAGSSKSQAESACAGIGLDASELPYINCVKSFMTLSRGGQLTPLGSVGRACVSAGFAPGSQDYASCVGNLNASIEGRTVGSD